MRRGTALDANTWRAVYAALDPMRSLAIEEVDALYVDRPDAPARRLAAQLKILAPSTGESSHFKVVVCGARGSGKSTELTRLAWYVRAEYAVVAVDLGAALPDGAGTLAALLLLGAALDRAAAKWSDPDFDLASPAAPPKRKSVGRTALKMAAAGLKVASEVTEQLAGLVGPVLNVTLPATAPLAVATGAVAGRTGSALGKLRAMLAKAALPAVVGPESLDQARALVEAVNALSDEIEDLAGRPVMLVAEGFDKRTDVSEVEAILRDIELLRDLRAPVALSGPINLRHDPRFSGAAGAFRIALLHNVLVTDRDGAVHEAGVSLLRQLWERRRDQRSLPVDALSDEAIERAARASTGLVRDFLSFLRDGVLRAFERGAPRVESQDVEDAIRERRLHVQSYLNDSRIALLQRVTDKGTLPPSEEADVLLFENIIVAHANGDTWFRPHAVLTEWLATLKAEHAGHAPDDDR